MEILPFSGSISPDALVGSTLDTFQWNGDSIIAVSESAVGIITVEGEGSASNLKAYYRLLDGFDEQAIDSAFIITTAAVASSVDHGTLYTAYSRKLLVHTIQGAGAESSITSVQTFDFYRLWPGVWRQCNSGSSPIRDPVSLCDPERDVALLGVDVMRKPVGSVVSTEHRRKRSIRLRGMRLL